MLEVLGILFITISSMVIALLLADVIRRGIRAKRVTKILMNTFPRQAIIQRQGRWKWYKEWMSTFFGELTSSGYDTISVNGVTVTWNGAVVTPS